VNCFFHHVGQPGAGRDFPRTVFGSIPISQVETAIKDAGPVGHQLIRDLELKFPSGSFNCWGVPDGAHRVVKNMARGDAVLLVESARIDGVVPALCEVKAFYPAEFRELSAALWGDEKYPYIFFFRTEPLILPWIEFLDQCGFKENWNPGGRVYSIASSRLADYGGVDGYIAFLRKSYATPVLG
jgi:5-methylcytosine-specific restriction enzyme A